MTGNFGVLQEDDKYKSGLRINSAEGKLRYFVGVCSSKRMDEATGNPQPAYKMDGMKIICEFPKPKGDETLDNVERKQVRGQAGQGTQGGQGRSG